MRSHKDIVSGKVVNELHNGLEQCVIKVFDQLLLRATPPANEDLIV